MNCEVIVIGPTFERLVEQSFDQIYGSVGGNTGIMLRILGTLQTIGSLTTDRLRRRAFREQVECIIELAKRTIPSLWAISPQTASLRRIIALWLKRFGPSSGQEGFTIIAIATMLSSASAINALPTIRRGQATASLTPTTCRPPWYKKSRASELNEIYRWRCGPKSAS